MAIVQGRVKVSGSVIVASYQMASGVIGEKRSVSRKPALWNFPALSNQVLPLNSVTSTTSVSPSHRPTECPM